MTTVPGRTAGSRSLRGELGDRVDASGPQPGRRDARRVRRRAHPEQDHGGLGLHRRARPGAARRQGVGQVEQPARRGLDVGEEPVRRHGATVARPARPAGRAARRPGRTASAAGGPRRRGARAPPAGRRSAPSSRLVQQVAATGRVDAAPVGGQERGLGPRHPVRARRRRRPPACGAAPPVPTWSSDCSMPATSSAAGAGAVRSAGASTGLPSKSVTR